MAYEYVRVKRYRARRRKPYRYLLCLLPIALAALWRFSPWFGQMALAPGRTLQLETQKQQEDAAGAARAQREYTLPAQTWYILQLGAFGDLSSAQTLADAFYTRGAAGAVWKDGEHHLVLAAAYDSRENARMVQENLLNYHQVDTVIKPVSIPEVRLLLKGTAAQLQALCDGVDSLSNLQHSLYHLSLSIDRGEMTLAAVRDALASHRDTLSALQSRLTQAFSGEMPPAAANLSQALTAVKGCLDETLLQESSTRTGAGIKQTQLMCIGELMAWSGALTVNTP